MPKPMIHIEENKDAELLSTLNEEAQSLHAALHPAIFKPFDKAAIQKAMFDFLAEPSCKAYVVFQGQMPIAYAIFYIREHKENAFQFKRSSIYIDQFAVLKDFRGAGAGHMLLKQAEKLAIENGIKTIELDHWSTNKIAADYFRRNGYNLTRESLVKVISFE